jgi:hypothetical protein
VSPGAGSLVRAAATAVPYVLIAVSLVVLSLVGLCLPLSRRRFALQAMDRMVGLASVLSAHDAAAEPARPAVGQP